MNDDSKEFFEGLKEQTVTVENNTNLQASDDDFEPFENDGYTDEPSDIEEPSIEASKVIDPDITSDICIDMIDGVQSPIFLLLHRKKLVSKYFKEKKDYKVAAEVYALDDADIATNYPDEVERCIKLKRKYKGMFAEFKAKTVEVPLSEEERTRLKEPMRMMVERSGFDMPPGVALAVCMAQIIINRLIDVYWE